MKVTGVTVHLANEDYDRAHVGPAAVPVLEDDDIDALEARIHETEHIIYPEVLRAIAEGRMTLDADRKIHSLGRLGQSGVDRAADPGPMTRISDFVTRFGKVFVGGSNEARNYSNHH
ncbi:MAG: formyltransferase family protein [Collinsella intestinalis]